MKLVPTPICSQCRNDTIPIIIDDGIGSSYYGDSYDFHSIKTSVSNCCASPVLEKTTSKPFTMNDYHEWEFHQKF